MTSLTEVLYSLQYSVRSSVSKGPLGREDKIRESMGDIRIDAPYSDRMTAISYSVRYFW